MMNKVIGLRYITGLVIISMMNEPILLIANPFTTGGTYNSLGGPSIQAKAAKTFSVPLSSKSTSFQLFNSNASSQIVPTPLSCDLASIRSNINMSANAANLGKDFQNFVKNSAHTFAVNKSIDFMSEQYAVTQCTTKLPQLQAEAAAEFTASQLPKITADVADKTTLITALGISTAARSVGTIAGPVPDPLAIVGGTSVTAMTAPIISAATGQAQAAQAALLAKKMDQCKTDAKSQFVSYINSAMSILNGNFWNEVALDAQQCALTKQQTNSNPGKGLFNFLSKSGTKTHDLGVFTVSINQNGGQDALQISKNSASETAAMKDSYQRTDNIVTAADATATDTLLNQTQKQRWSQFKADWAMVSTKPDKQALVSLFSQYSINDQRATDPKFSDYWISQIYYGYLKNNADTALEQLNKSDTKMAQAAVTGSGIAELEMVTELRALRKQSLLQSKLLAQIINQKNSLSGGGGAMGSGGGGGTASNAGAASNNKIIIDNSVQAIQDVKKSRSSLLGISLH